MDLRSKKRDVTTRYSGDNIVVAHNEIQNDGVLELNLTMALQVCCTDVVLMLFCCCRYEVNVRGCWVTERRAVDDCLLRDGV